MFLNRFKLASCDKKCNLETELSPICDSRAPVVMIVDLAYQKPLYPPLL